MQVRAWMSSPVHTVTPATLAGDAVLLLRQHRMHHLPVLEGLEVVGVVTDRDLRGVEPGRPVGSIMSRPVHTVDPRATMAEAAQLLFDRRIGCLPVLDGGRLVGILTQTDAVAALVRVVRLQVGGPHAEVLVADRPDAMALAHQAIRPLGVEVARLIGAIREPSGPEAPVARVRLEIETRQMSGVLDALRGAGLRLIHPDGGVEGAAPKKR